MANKLEQLKQLTTIVCDTGDINSIKRYTPTDATTNPSLIYAAAQDPNYLHLIDNAIEFGQKHAPDESQKMNFIMNKLVVNFGVEILKIVPGRVSTEVDARLSFDTEGSIHKALCLIDLYREAGIDSKRILIKLASTWEGIQAAKHLEKESIHCNMTLMFSLAQAIAAAEVNATLISPFVGRILDWYKAHEKPEGYPSDQDPGVLSVKKIYAYYKKFGYKTQVMGASFRNIDEILELAGCDLLTIAPKLLQELEQSEGSVDQKLSSKQSASENLEKIEVDEKHFRWMLNDDPMANDKLSEGIRKFAQDQQKLEAFVAKRIQEK